MCINSSSGLITRQVQPNGPKRRKKRVKKDTHGFRYNMYWYEKECKVISIQKYLKGRLILVWNAILG